MSNKKYNDNVDVNWGSVLSLYRKKINSLVFEGNHYLSLYEKDSYHRFDSYLPFDRANAVRCASEVIESLSELNILRRFLKYKPLSYSDVKCEMLIKL